MMDPSKEDRRAFARQRTGQYTGSGHLGSGLSECHYPVATANCHYQSLPIVLPSNGKENRLATRITRHRCGTLASERLPAALYGISSLALLVFNTI